MNGMCAQTFGREFLAETSGLVYTSRQQWEDDIVRALETIGNRNNYWVAGGTYPAEFMKIDISYHRTQFAGYHAGYYERERKRRSHWHPVVLIEHEKKCEPDFPPDIDFLQTLLLRRSTAGVYRLRPERNESHRKG